MVNDGTTRVLGLHVNPLTLDQSADRVREWMNSDERLCRFVVTPNLQHVRLYHASEEFRAAYARADLVLPDGMPLVWSARLTGGTVTERVAGSDLATEILIDRSARKFTYFLLGGAPGVAEDARRKISVRNVHAKCVGICAPPRGFEHDSEVCDAIVDAINAAEPDLLVIGLGAPKQEIWISRHAQRLHVKVALCVGAAIDFLAGNIDRAPKWMQHVGLEWAYRISQEPGRLLPRYACDAIAFPLHLLGDVIDCQRRKRNRSG